MSHFHSLIIKQIEYITQDAAKVVFSIPDTLRDKFAFTAGQYITLRFNLKGEEVRRSYSICSSAKQNDSLQIGVKRLENGLVSNHIINQLGVGTAVDVMPPNGLFTLDQQNQPTDYYLFAAGSGITPILSIIQTLLNTDSESHVHLIYGNRTQADMMFSQELSDLHSQYSHKFTITYYLSRAKKSLSGLFARKSKALNFNKGRINAQAINTFLEKNVSVTGNNQYFVCGPNQMIEHTVLSLRMANIDESLIKTEYFVANTQQAKESTVAAGEASSEASNGSDQNNQQLENDDQMDVNVAHLHAALEDEQIETTIEPGQTILQSLLEAGYNPPYSCESGVCSTCVCKLISGKVHMNNNMALSDDEVANGLILSCQSQALTAVVKVEYED